MAVTLQNRDVVSLSPETRSVIKDQSLRGYVRQALQQYFTQLDGQEPSDLHRLVMREVEIPLIKIVLQYTRGNQSRAAKILGISRGTLRKKMAMYGLD